MKTDQSINQKLHIWTIFAICLGIGVVVIAVSIVIVLFFHPADRALRKTQTDPLFQAFELQFPQQEQIMTGFRRYTVEYRAQAAHTDTNIVLAKNHRGKIYMYCDGVQSSNTSELTRITTKEFYALIQQESLCSGDGYEAWEISE